MKALIQKIIRFRNPSFTFDPKLSSYLLLCLIIEKGSKILRGFKTLFFLKSPKYIMLGKNVSFQYAKKIKWGNWVNIGRNATLSGLGKKGLIIGNNVSIGDCSHVIVSTSLNNIGKHILIKDNVGIGEFAYLGGGGGLEIGEGCIVGQYFSCHPENHNFSENDKEIRHQGVTRKGIKIGANCWIGSKVTILDGVSIGEGCVIAAGAVVNKSFPAKSIIGGVPAKVLGVTHKGAG